MSAAPPLTAHGPFRLAAVAVSHGWFQTAPFSWDPESEELGRIERLGGRARTLRMRGEDGGVRVAADGRALGAPARAEGEARVRRMLQLDADLSGFPDAVRAVDPGLARDLAAYGGGRMLAGTTLYEDVVKGICGTNVTWRQAVGMIGAIASLGADGAFPEPDALLRAGEGPLRERARVGYRAPFVLAAARSAIDGTLDGIERDSAAGDRERAHAGLIGLAGVGPSTAGFLVLLMGHFDRPSIDSATIRVAAREWFDGRRPSPAEVCERIAPAEGFAGLVLAWSTLRSWQREAGLSSL